MPTDDKTKELLTELLKGLYSQQADSAATPTASYLIAGDQQFLGNIAPNRYDQSSILNQYGPYGSKYSPTSIFNPYSPYGSQYGVWSVNNPYCLNPPKLFISGSLLGVVSANRYVANRIPTEAFLYTLEHDVASLLSGRLVESESAARRLQRASFIEASDGTFLGSLNPSPYDVESIFNAYGSYGSQFSQTSIFNPYCPYGGQFSQFSPFNPYASDPPKIYLHGEFIGRLTVNSVFHPRVDPNSIRDWASRKLPYVS